MVQWKMGVSPIVVTFFQNQPFLTYMIMGGMGERVVACDPTSAVLEALERMAPVAAMDVSSLVVRGTQHDSAMGCMNDECMCKFLKSCLYWIYITFRDGNFWGGRSHDGFPEADAYERYSQLHVVITGTPNKNHLIPTNPSLPSPEARLDVFAAPAAWGAWSRDVFVAVDGQVHIIIAGIMPTYINLL